MAECSEIELLLGPFDDGELEPHEMQEVARHLAGCPNCEATLADFSALGRGLRTALPEPPLEGFASTVMKRVAALPRPLSVRLHDLRDAFGRRFAASLAMGAASAALAILTAIVFTPYARDLLARGRTETLEMVRRSERAATVHLASVAEKSHAVISRLESEIPSVAVWSDPDTETTVIWVPDEQ